ncbi:unnamed protein product [Caenorhabditis sp. 36 PRJEB53466]|nr:unnamed protein product [Caenorhabditis sp. 36 PRJEB53466]
MRGWNDCPMEMKHEIIKKMEFRTRFCFRHVAKSTQMAVDSVRLFVPRIRIHAKNENDVTMHIFLGIEKEIKMEFSKEEWGVTHIKMSGHSVTNKKRKKKIRNVKCDNPALLAVTIFKHVAIHPKTLLGGVEFDMNLSRFILEKIDEMLEGLQIRTRIITVPSENRPLPFVLRCMGNDLVEAQLLLEYENPQRIRVRRKVDVFTRRVSSTIDERDFDTFRFMSATYFRAFKIGDNPAARVEYLRTELGAEIEKHGEMDYSTRFFRDGYFVCGRINSCGGMQHSSSVEFRDKTFLEGCHMRMRCAVHSDPFEYWYQKRVEEHLDWFECIFPKINGESSLACVRHETGLNYKRWKYGPSEQSDKSSVRDLSDNDEESDCEEDEEDEDDVDEEEEQKSEKARCTFLWILMFFVFFPIRFAHMSQ